MASRAGSGVEIDVALVPCRETRMSAYEIMLSESQERMLVVARRGREHEAQAIFTKWGLDAVVIGRVSDDKTLRILRDGALAAEIPVTALVDEAPLYDRDATRPAYLDDAHIMGADALPESHDLAADLQDLLSCSIIASKAWVYRQYDSMVRAATVLLPGGDAAVIALPGFKRGVAMTTDGNGRYVYLDPRTGGMHAVAEAARNLTCSGARALAVTDCLNFGNPENPDVFYQFVESVTGIAEACRALDTPVVSGNVSFYNETNGEDIYPTPIIGMVGVVDDLSHLTTIALKESGNALALLGAPAETLGGSEYVALRAGQALGPTPPIDLDLEARTQLICREAIQAGCIRAAHDVSDGGLAVALAEMSIAGGLGADLAWEIAGRTDLALFGEGGSRIVVETREANLDALERSAQEHAVPFVVLGRVSEEKTLSIQLRTAGSAETLELNAPVDMLRRRWEGAIPWAMR
jgi:phosphoribosylformylglycinamidine synthase